MLNLAQTKQQSTIAQLSPNQAPLYYCATQFKSSPTLLWLNSAPVPVPVSLLQTSYNLAKFSHNLAKPQYSCTIDSAMLSQAKSSQVKSSPTLILLNLVPLYYSSTQPKPLLLKDCSTIAQLLLNSVPVPISVSLPQTGYNLAKFYHNLAKPQVKSSQVKSSQVKSSQAKSSQVKQSKAKQSKVK